MAVHLNVFYFLLLCDFTFYPVRNVKWFGNLSEGALCENSQSLWQTHETQGPSTSIARSHMPQLLTAFPLRLCSADPQKSDFDKSHSRREHKVVHSLWHTHETQGPSTSIPLSHMPQLLTAFPLRLSSADPQKCDFRKSHSRREYRVVHFFWNGKVWQSGVRYRH